MLGEEVDFYSWQNTDATGMEAISWVRSGQLTPREMKATNNAEMKSEPEHVQMCTFKDGRIAGNTHIS